MAQIILFGGNFAPRGWMFCQGQLLAISQYDALFALLGTTFGGDGQTTFGLPDFRGRIPVGAGQGTGLSPMSLGQMSGTPTTTLLANNMPTHNHSAVGAVGATSQSGTTGNPVGAVPGQAPSNVYAASGSSPLGGVTASTQPQGGSQPFPLMMPYVGMNFVICTEGIFPSRN